MHTLNKCVCVCLLQVEIISGIKLFLNAKYAQNLFFKIKFQIKAQWYKSSFFEYNFYLNEYLELMLISSLLIKKWF